MSSEGTLINIERILEFARLNRLKRRSVREPQILRILKNPFLLRQSALEMRHMYLLFRLVRRILKNIILISVEHSKLPLLHIHYLQYSRRTYIYRVFVNYDPYHQVIHLPKVLHLPLVHLFNYLPRGFDILVASSQTLWTVHIH